MRASNSCIPHLFVWFRVWLYLRRSAVDLLEEAYVITCCLRKGTSTLSYASQSRFYEDAHQQRRGSLYVFTAQFAGTSRRRCACGSEEERKNPFEHRRILGVEGLVRETRIQVDEIMAFAFASNQGVMNQFGDHNGGGHNNCNNNSNPFGSWNNGNPSFSSGNGFPKSSFDEADPFRNSWNDDNTSFTTTRSQFEKNGFETKNSWNDNSSTFGNTLGSGFGAETFSVNNSFTSQQPQNKTKSPWDNNGASLNSFTNQQPQNKTKSPWDNNGASFSKASFTDNAFSNQQSEIATTFDFNSNQDGFNNGFNNSFNNGFNNFASKETKSNDKKDTNEWQWNQSSPFQNSSSSNQTSQGNAQSSFHTKEDDKQFTFAADQPASNKSSWSWGSDFKLDSTDLNADPKTRNDPLVNWASFPEKSDADAGKESSFDWPSSKQDHKHGTQDHKHSSSSQATFKSNSQAPTMDNLERGKETEDPIVSMNFIPALKEPVKPVRKIKPLPPLRPKKTFCWKNPRSFARRKLYDSFSEGIENSGRACQLNMLQLMATRPRALSAEDLMDDLLTEETLDSYDSTDESENEEEEDPIALDPKWNIHADGRRVDPAHTKLPCTFSNLCVLHPEFGSVEWLVPVTLCSWNDIKKNVHFGKGRVILYPNRETVPDVGKGLNVHARMSVFNVSSKNKLRMEKKLRKVCADVGAKFVEYTENGVWIMEVNSS
eukprot:jgi/Bigna1/87453/estExt_fgenesh1_pg.C_200160